MQKSVMAAVDANDQQYANNSCSSCSVYLHTFIFYNTLKAVNIYNISMT
jgi:hypothetical protein